MYFIIVAILGAMSANLALPLVRVHARKALELEPSVPEGHVMLGIAAAFLDYDWKKAEMRFQPAMAHASVSPLVRMLYGWSFLMPLGRAAEAVQQIDLALQDDPLNLFFVLQSMFCLIALGRDDEAARRLHKILELHPSMPPAVGMLGIHHFLRGELDQALALTKKSHALQPGVPHAIGTLAGMLARVGDSAGADALIQKFQPDAFGGPRGLACYNWVLGNLDAAADWIEKAIDQHDPIIAAMLRQWYGRALRNTPRWAALMRKLNLPEA